MQVIVLIIGGGGGGAILLLIIALVIAVAIGTGAMAALIAALTMFLIWLAAIVAGCGLLAGLGWYLTRDYRERKREAAEYQAMQRQVAYEQRQDQRRIEREHRRSLEQARVMAPIAAVVAEAINRGRGQEMPSADDIAEALIRRRRYAPPVYRAEVIGSNEDPA